MKNLTLRLRLASLLTLILLAVTAAYSQITPLGDTYTNSATPTTNYGAKPLLDVDGATQITYIQFNLASVPAGASVRQATLKLYVNSVTIAGAFELYAVNGAWTESVLTFDLAPALGSVIDSNVPITTADKNQYILIPMTATVQDWLTTPSSNFDVALVAVGTFNATFDSKETTSTSHPPELDIVFAGDGTLIGVTTESGSGLTGGGTSGTLNLSLTNGCAANQVLQYNGSSWAYAALGTGTITGVTAGTDLTGGGPSGNMTLNLNTAATNALYAQLNAANTFSGSQTVFGALLATNFSPDGDAVIGSAAATTGTSVGVIGETNSPSGYGVEGENLATTGTAIGVLGNSLSNAGTGVEGNSTFTGVFGDSNGLSTTGQNVIPLVGVWGDSGGNGGGGVLGTADDSYAGHFANNSPAYSTVFAENDITTAGGVVLLVL